MPKHKIKICECGYHKDEYGNCTNYPYCPNSIDPQEMDVWDWNEDKWKEETDFKPMRIKIGKE